MLRIFFRLVLALLVFCIFVAILWVWMAQGCFAWDPPPGWRAPAANCDYKRGVAGLAWPAGFALLIWWAVQPRKKPR